MRVDTSITCCSCQVLVLAVWDVKVGLWVTIFLGQSEVNDVDLVPTLADAHQEIVRLDITVDERFGMDVLDTGDELIGKQQDCLQGKFAVAKVEQILQTGAEKVEHHSIVVTLGTEPANERNTDSSCQRFVDTGFIFQLRVLGLDALQFDGNFFAGDDVGAWIDTSASSKCENASSHLNRYRQNFHCRSCVRYGICSPHGGPGGNYRLA